MDIKRILYYIRRHFYRAIDHIAFNKVFDLSNTVAVFGPQRSGTTWFIEVLNMIPEFLSIFEPLNVLYFKEISPRYEGRPYINPDTEDNEYKALISRIFVGKSKVYDPIIRMNLYDIFKRLKANRLLLKFVRGNRLLPWMSKNFTFSTNYFIIRHPCSVISSQIQLGKYGYGFGADVPKEEILKEVAKMDFLENELVEKIQTVSCLEEILAVMYGLDYIVPLKLASEIITPVHYEALVLDPETHFSEIFHNLGADKYLKAGIARAKTPSQTTNKTEKNSLTDAEYQIRKWKDRLTTEQIQDIARVLEWFDIKFSVDGYRIMDYEINYRINGNIIFENE
mgnify:FL=1|jgi:hypothetical protein